MGHSGHITSSLPLGDQEEPVQLLLQPHREGLDLPPSPFLLSSIPRAVPPVQSELQKRSGQTRRSLLHGIYLPKLGFPKHQTGKTGKGHSCSSAGREWHWVGPAMHLWHPAQLWTLGPPPGPRRMLTPGGLSSAHGLLSSTSFLL